MTQSRFHRDYVKQTLAPRVSLNEMQISQEINKVLTQRIIIINTKIARREIIAGRNFLFLP